MSPSPKARSHKETRPVAGVRLRDGLNNFSQIGLHLCVGNGGGKGVPLTLPALGAPPNLLPNPTRLFIIRPMNCVPCSYENIKVRAAHKKPACKQCIARANLRGAGSHNLPWYVRVFGRATITPSKCWEYTASHGYGSPLMVGKRLVRPHRLVLENKEPQPPNHEADHSCHNRSCVNPKHLRWLTHQQNCQNRRKPRMTDEEKRTKYNSYMRRYYTKNKTLINERRRKRKPAHGSNFKPFSDHPSGHRGLQPLGQGIPGPPQSPCGHGKRGCSSQTHPSSQHVRLII